jgi:hypothetical protein
MIWFRISGRYKNILKILIGVLYIVTGDVKILKSQRMASDGTRQVRVY